MIVLDPYVFKGFFENDPDLGFRVRPGVPYPDGIPTNQFGFNDRDYPLQKTPGIYRILVVGDSFSWAGGREGNYTALLERMLENHYGSHKIDVINSGYTMTHTGEQLAMLKKYGLQYDPDLVILGFFVGNDFLDADPDFKTIVVNGEAIPIRKSAEHKFLGYPIILRTRLLLFAERKYLTYVDQKKAKQEAGSQGQKGTFSEEGYLNIEKRRLGFFNSSAVRAGRFQRNIDNILSSISEMDALLKARHTKLIVGIYPDEFQVNENLRNTVFAKFNLKPEDYDLDLAQNLLKSFLGSKGITFIDFTERFRAEGKKQDLYLLRDSHWNKNGNQLAADMLFEYFTNGVNDSLPAP
jgi:hypothetical protein